MDKKEVLRYLRTNSSVEDNAIIDLIDKAAADIENYSDIKTLYRIFDCVINDDVTEIGGLAFKSKRFADNMDGCHRVVVFGATLGLQIDRMIKAASFSDLALAMAYQAAASVLIEEVCDLLEQEIISEHNVRLRSRYSPGYYDLDITEQRKIFSLIDLTKRIGVTLTDSCQMMPSKSVTAFIGIEGTNDQDF